MLDAQVPFCQRSRIGLVPDEVTAHNLHLPTFGRNAPFFRTSKRWRMLSPLRTAEPSARTASRRIANRSYARPRIATPSPAPHSKAQFPMKKYEAVIVGQSPLLTSKFDLDVLDNAARPISAKSVTPQEAAEASVYRDAQARLSFPTPAIARLLRDAGTNHKMKGTRRSVRYVVPAAVRLIGEMTLLTNGDGKTAVTSYGIDTRSVVNRATKGRRLCHRARFEHWSMRLQLTVNDSLLEPDLVRLLLSEGGEQLGIGAFRPEKGGPFGTFAVVEWNEKS